MPEGGFPPGGGGFMIAAVIVMKFGGTSVGDARSIRQVVQIVRQHLGRAPVVVVSAHAGVTDELLAIAAAASDGPARAAAVADHHRTILRDLGLPADLLDPLLAELVDLARGLRLVGAASPKAIDLLASYGERCSARTVAAAMRAGGVAATAVDAFAAGLRTDGNHGRARPLPDDGRIAKHLAAIEGVPIVTGFVAADELGNVTTLGRNGSDYSAALFGAAVGAEQIQIWKDVDGIRTADPKLVPGARPIRRLGYAAACDLAAFGSKVLHPAAMLPAMQKGIHLAVRNTQEPAAEGTLVVPDADDGAPGVRAIAHRANVALVTVESPRLSPQHTFLARVFGALDAAGCDGGPLAIAEAAVTTAVDAGRSAAAAAALAGIGEVRVEPDHAVVGIVGAPRALGADAAAAVFTTLAGLGIGVRCAGQGPHGGTLAAVLRAGELARAVVALHSRFFA